MATYTTNEAQSYAQVPGVGMGAAQVAVATLELGTALSANDVLEFLRLPAGAVVYDGCLIGDDIDTGTETLEIDIGWAANGSESADADGLLDSGVISGDAVTGYKPEVGIRLPLGGKLLTDGPQLFTAETVIQGDVVAAAATGGTGTLTLWVHFFVDDQWAKTSVS